MMTGFKRHLVVAAILTMGAGTAHAADPLPNLVNLNFSQYTGSAPKGYFTDVQPVGWTGGTGLIFIDSMDATNCASCGKYLNTYGSPTGNLTGNYVEADGNPDYEGSFNYTVNGLTPGKTYTLSFYQGASSQQGFGYNSVTGTNSETTNQWIVSLGNTGLSVDRNTGTDPVFGSTSTYYSTDPNASIAASPLMTVPYQGTVGWDYVSVDLTAYAESEVLSFLAWGDKGSTVNLPPIAFLAGVNSPPGLGSTAPEPATWATMVLGFLGAGAMLRTARRRRNRIANASNA